MIDNQSNSKDLAISEEQASQPIVVEMFKPYGNEPTDNIHQANLIHVFVEKGLPAKDIALLMEAQSKSAIQIAKAHNEIDLIIKNENNKRWAFALSALAIAAPLFPVIDSFAAYSISSIGAVGFATSLYSFFGAKAFEAGKKFRDIFRQFEKREDGNDG